MRSWRDAGPRCLAYTDDNAVYDDLANRETVDHRVSEFVRGMAHTNGVESFWSMLKRGYQGTYHKMSVKHLARYANEFSGRHNVRMADTLDQMELTMQRTIGRRLCYRNLVKGNGLQSGARAMTA